METLKKIIFWSYSRETSVYVIFCLLIIAFIFLTPRSWFDRRDPAATRTSRLIVQEQDFFAPRPQMERRVKELSGRADAEIIETRQRTGPSGEKIYEIEIR